MTTSQRQLDGLVAVVTGGGGRLGSHMCIEMASRGARVVVADLDGGTAERTAARIVDLGEEALPVEVDVASELDVAAAFDLIGDRFGGVDVLVNNAAPTRLVLDDAPVTELSLSTWDTMVNGILRGALLCSQKAIPSMIARQGGSIINIASIHAHAGDPEVTAYPVAKAGLLGLTRAIATQYGHAGVRAVTVTLGTFVPSSVPAEWRQEKTKHQLVPRDGRPVDVANVVAFLASREASFITGSDIAVEGGLLAHLPSFADPATRLRR